MEMFQALNSCTIVGCLLSPGNLSWYRGITMPHANPELEQLFWDTLEEARKAGYHEDNYDPTKNENFEEFIYPVLTEEERYMLSQA